MTMAWLCLLPCCEELDDDPQKYLEPEDSLPVLQLSDVAVLLSELPIGEEQVREVYDAVTSSSWNGYDEEYMMTDLFREPGSGVGDDRISDMARSAKRKAMERAGVATRAAREYGTPLKSLIEEHLKDRQTKSGRPLTKSDGTVITADSTSTFPRP